MSDAETPPLYPRYCFHLAPTVNSWCFLRAVDVHALEQHPGFEGMLRKNRNKPRLLKDFTGENFYFHKNLPIKWVRIVGVVVAIDDFGTRRVYTVDDSTGACIACMVILPDLELDLKRGNEDGAATKKNVQVEAMSGLLTNPFESIDVGSVVDVKGGMSTFREEKQITIEKMLTVRSTEQEMALWEKRARFRKEVLNKPWVLRNRDIRSCRKEAERCEEDAARRKRRIKAARHSEKPAKSVSHDDKRSHVSKRLDLRQVIQNGPKGKYDALGL